MFSVSDPERVDIKEPKTKKTKTHLTAGVRVIYQSISKVVMVDRMTLKKIRQRIIHPVT